MIPSTQRPDGSWRKARKIRTGFNTASGGASRYIPPAFRPGATNRDDEHATATSGQSSRATGTNSFLSAAVFLLAAKATSVHCVGGQRQQQQQQQPPPTCPSSASYRPPCPQEVENDGAHANNAVGVDGHGDCQDDGRQQEQQQRKDGAAVARERGGAHGGGGTGGGLREELLRSVVVAAKDDLGCSECRRLLPHPSIMWDSKSKSRPRDTNSSGGWLSESPSMDQDTGWWSKLRQVTRGWKPQYLQRATAAVDLGGQEEGGQTGGLEWVGFELLMRSNDVGHPEGQNAIVEFLQSRVTVHSRRKHEARKHSDTTTTRKTSAKADDTCRVDSMNPCVPDASDAAPPDGARKKSNEEGGVEDRGVGVALDGDTETSDQEPTADLTMTTDRGGQEKAIHVLAAVLVFDGSSLSKRGRAELHRKAEEASGAVASSSHGFGDDRFLALTCRGFEDGRAPAAEPDLWAEQVALARRLYRLAQLKYHSRYERLSHREIREVVASGGPTPDDHPDLFCLLVEDDHTNNQGGEYQLGRAAGDRDSKRKTNERRQMQSPPKQDASERAMRGEAVWVGRGSEAAEGGISGLSGHVGEIESDEAGGLLVGGRRRQQQKDAGGIMVEMDADEGDMAEGDVFLPREACPW